MIAHDCLDSLQGFRVVGFFFFFWLLQVPVDMLFGFIKQPLLSLMLCC